MYLLKHICQVNSVINQLIGALVLTTSACLSSFTTQGSAITAGNGHVNTNLFFSYIAIYKQAIAGIQPLALHNCNVMDDGLYNGANTLETARQGYPTIG